MRPAHTPQRQRHWLPWLAAGFALLLLAVGPAWQSGAFAQERVVRFGAALSLTGRFVDNARLTKDGYDFYVQQVNERFGGIEIRGVKYRVEIKYYDDQSDPIVGARLVEKLIVEDGIKLLLGPYSSTMTLPISKVVERYQVPMVVAHAATNSIYEQGNKYIFATLNTIDQYFEGVLQAAMEATPRPQTVAVLYENLLAPQASAEAAVKVAQRLGLRVVYNQKYPSGIKDLSSELAVIRSRNPDILLGAGYIGDMILLAKQADGLGVRPKLFAMLLGPTHPSFVPSLRSIANGIVEPVQWAPNMKWKDEIFGWTARDYFGLFKEQFGYEPDYHPPQSTAALEVFHRALQNTGTFEPQKVRDAIAQINIETAYGPVRFNDKGVNIGKTMAVIQLQGNVPVVVYPQQVRERKLIYPRRYSSLR